MASSKFTTPNAWLATPLAWDAKKQENLAIFDEVPELVERAILSEAGVRNLRKKTTNKPIVLLIIIITHA